MWGLELVYACWLLVGPRFLAGMGSGRKRLNLLGAYCPDDEESLDLRLTRDNINGEQFVNLPRLIRATHPETERFVPGLDRARYDSPPVVKDWLRRHPEFELELLPTYSPNLNLSVTLRTLPGTAQAFNNNEVVPERRRYTKLGGTAGGSVR